MSNKGGTLPVRGCHQFPWATVELAVLLNDHVRSPTTMAGGDR